MAEIQPLRALHYDLSVVGPLGDLVAPPYDVIDAQQRAALLARSPFNVVAVDLPQATRHGDSAADGAPDPYTSARDLFDSWQMQGIVVRDGQPAIWAHTQQYTGPDGSSHTRRGFFCRVRIEEYGAGRVRPHERTHPGPKEDRLRLTRATRANMSPIFSLYSDPTNAAWQALAPATAATPWGEATDGQGTIHRLWRVSDSEAIAAVQAATRHAELLIADGHHRYETAQAYAREIGGADGSAPEGERTEGERLEDERTADQRAPGQHDYVLMCLVALEDPGLTVFPTHRLVKGLDPARRQALADALHRDFDIAEVSEQELVPPAGSGPLQLGYIDSNSGRTLRLTLKDQAIADAALPQHSAAYRRLDTGVLETLLLKGALRLSDEDISHLHDFGYARDGAQALALVRGGEYDVAFLMRPTPIAQVGDVAAAGENMPPKSTYFFPKLLTGLLFNPLS